MTGVGPGPSSREGLKWVARVGPGPLGSWAVAMGWGRTAVYSVSISPRAREQAHWTRACERAIEPISNSPAAPAGSESRGVVSEADRRADGVSLSDGSRDSPFRASRDRVCPASSHLRPTRIPGRVRRDQARRSAGHHDDHQRLQVTAGAVPILLSANDC